MKRFAIIMLLFWLATAVIGCGYDDGTRPRFFVRPHDPTSFSPERAPNQR